MIPWEILSFYKEYTPEQFWRFNNFCCYTTENLDITLSAETCRSKHFLQSSQHIHLALLPVLLFWLLLLLDLIKILKFSFSNKNENSGMWSFLKILHVDCQLSIGNRIKKGVKIAFMRYRKPHFSCVIYPLLDNSE